MFLCDATSVALFIFQDNPLENLNLAFDIAEKYLDIPRMLDPEGKNTILYYSSPGIAITSFGHTVRKQKLGVTNCLNGKTFRPFFLTV